MWMSDREWVDYYQVLGISVDATAKEISSAYRSLALKYHPDKSSSDESVQRFYALSKAYQVLTDVEARRAFDVVLAGRMAQKQREADFDSTRREMRDELLRKEKEARKRKADEEEAEIRLQHEMERIRKEAQLEADRKKREKQTEKDVIGSVLFDDLDRTLKISAELILTEERIRETLKRYGAIENVLISKKQKSGIVQFIDILAAKSVMMDADRHLLKPLSFSWAKGHPPVIDNVDKAKKTNSKDLESLTLMRMRQAAERKQLRAKLETDSKLGD
jgi:DnaJ family protein C protein 17